MKTIAELKAEIAQRVAQWVIRYRENLPTSVMNKTIDVTFVSLSQAISEDVAGCTKIVDHETWGCMEFNFPYGTKPLFCKDVEEPQKCEGCKGKLWVKSLIEGGEPPSVKESNPKKDVR